MHAWWIYALLSAFFASLTAILAKIGIKGVDSDVATGLSWLCYFRALQSGKVTLVAPIDKASLALTLLLAVVFLGEALTFKAAMGAGLILTGTLVLIL